MIDRICNNSICTACYACENSCPVNAITLKENEAGSVYPAIGENCTECGLCQRICPANTPVLKSAPQAAYAGYGRDREVRRTSTSGGILYLVAGHFDGAVYGAAYTDGLTVSHIRIEHGEGLEKTQGSKYVHSNPLRQFSSVKEDLARGGKVLFIGTPCQVAGLRAFLGKDHEGLFTADFVCHGVPDESTLEAYIKAEFPKADIAQTTVRFRDEKGYHMTVYENGRLLGALPFTMNYYYHSFLEGWSLRENCHACPYADINRVSDLTACDCWPFEGGLTEEEKRGGLSGILVNTEKGRALLDAIRNETVLSERTVEEALAGVVHLQHPVFDTKEAQRFRRLKAKHGSVYALKNTLPKKRLAFTLRKLKNAGNRHH